MKTIVAFAAAALLWLAAPQGAEAQMCQSEADCAAGLLCVQGSCVRAQVQVGATGTVTVQAQTPGGYVQPQPQPQPQGQVYVQPQAQPQPLYAQPAPQPEPRYEDRPIWGLLIGGIVVFAVGWVGEILVSLIGGLAIGVDNSVGSSSGIDGSDFALYGLIPLAGPFAQMAVTNGDEGWMPWLIVDSILQLGGLTMIILGAVLTQRTEVYAELDDGVSLAVLPSFGPDGGSLNAILRF